MISKQFWYLICVTTICNPALWAFLYKFYCFFNAGDDFKIVSKHLIWFADLFSYVLKTTIWIRKHEKVEKYHSTLVLPLLTVYLIAIAPTNITMTATTATLKWKSLSWPKTVNNTQLMFHVNWIQVQKDNNNNNNKNLFPL